MASPELIHLDGTTLEGGGQLVRLALSLSSLTGRPIHITSIRGNRSRGGGLKGSHLAAVELLAKACAAKTKGMELKSKELTFEPCVDRTERLSSDSANWWKSLKDQDGKSVGRAVEIKMTTPGSIFLVFQALLPYLLFSSSGIGRSGQGSTSPPLPVKLTVHGGTNVTSSPSFEYVQQVLLPTLGRIGIPPITLTLSNRGWTHGRAQVGSATFTITPFSPDSGIPAFSLLGPSPADKLKAFHASILASPSNVRSHMRNSVTEAVRARWGKDPQLEFPVDEDSGHPKRLYLLLVAETNEGLRYGRDCLYDRKISNVNEAIGNVVKQVVHDMAKELDNGGPTDEFMEDQLAVFMALGMGKSVVAGDEPSCGVSDSGNGAQKRNEPTLHTKTARWVAETILDVRFDDQDGSCEGVGLRALGESDVSTEQ